METDVFILGGGPAGLSAAFEVASRGLKVMIADENPYLGGQLVQQTQKIGWLPSEFASMPGFKLAEKLIQRLKNLPVEIKLEHSLAGLYQDNRVGLTDGSKILPVQAKKMIIATGAYESPVPFLKWTLPGIITIGAAQILVNRDLVIPGKVAVIMGTSDFALDVAIQLHQVGIKIAGIIEPSNQIAASGHEKIEYLKAAGVRLYLNSTIREARGKGQVSEVDIEKGKSIETLHVDLVCLDGGRKPILDSFYLLNCSFRYEEMLGGWVPQYNEFFQTSQEDVFIAGNAAGITGQGAIILTGMIAGISVAEKLGAMGTDEANELRKRLWGELAFLEKKYDKEVWKSRVEHVGNFSKPHLENQYIT